MTENRLTKEQLDMLDRDDLVSLTLEMQDRVDRLDHQMQVVLEQLADGNRRRFGQSSEKLADNQMAFKWVDGEVVIFNEAEALAEDPEDNGTDVAAHTRHPRQKGKIEEDIKGLEVIPVSHELSEAELADIYRDESYNRLPDEIYRRYLFIPSKVAVEEHHVAVYSGKKSEKMVKAGHPKMLFSSSLASPTSVAGILNAKYVNAVPLYRLEAEYRRRGIQISRQTMSHWVIGSAERYLSVLYDELHRRLYGYHVIQADETPLLVNRDGRPAGSKSYMWVYRTGERYRDAVILYDYQKTRNAAHPREFLKDFSGICVTDGYQAYHTIENEREDLTVSGCWVHARRRFDEALKAMSKSEQRGSTAYKALKLIQAICSEDNRLDALSPEERLEQRQLVVKPLVEAYFAWVYKKLPYVLKGSKTHNGLQYSINQEKYLKAFLDDPDIPMDNNAAERAIRPFCVGKKNWVMSDTVAGAQASAIVYSIAETAKANGLKPYEYFVHLLSVIPEHMDDTDRSFIEELLPWSDSLPAECRKQIRN